MRHQITGKFFLITLLLLIACSQDRTAEIDRAMRHYDKLILRLAADSIAMQYQLHGQLAGEGATPVYGRDSIRELLQSFKGATVYRYESTTDHTTFKGDTAFQTGIYVQTVKIPSGDTLELGGKYTTTWIRENTSWLIHKMYTHDYRNLKEERKSNH
jgi:ketosteroid isomerase-like protein